MSIPDLPTVPEVSAQSKSGLQYHIMGTVQQTLALDLQPNQMVYSDLAHRVHQDRSLSVRIFLARFFRSNWRLDNLSLCTNMHSYAPKKASAWIFSLRETLVQACLPVKDLFSKN